MISYSNFYGCATGGLVFAARSDCCVSQPPFTAPGMEASPVAQGIEISIESHRKVIKFLRYSI